MKKNVIAVLLVLALVTFGVFAANQGSDTSADFQVTTTVSALSLVSVTSAEFEGNTLELWNSFLPTKTISSAVTIGSGTLAWANVISNNKNGVDVYVKASPMASAVEANEYEIDYTVTVNTKSYATKSSTANVKFLEAANTKATTALFIGSYAVTAEVDGDSFNNAPQDTYTGTITFTFSAT